MPHHAVSFELGTESGAAVLSTPCALCGGCGCVRCRVLTKEVGRSTAGCQLYTGVCGKGGMCGHACVFGAGTACGLFGVDTVCGCKSGRGRQEQHPVRTTGAWLASLWWCRGIGRCGAGLKGVPHPGPGGGFGTCARRVPHVPHSMSLIHRLLCVVHKCDPSPASVAAGVAAAAVCSRCAGMPVQWPAAVEGSRQWGVYRYVGLPPCSLLLLRCGVSCNVPAGCSFSPAHV